MKKILLAGSVWVLCLAAPASTAEFQDPGAVLAVDFPAGWAVGKSDDPAVVLKLEKGKSFFEFTRLDSELSDYYLKARVKEQVDSLRSKGNTLAGDTRTAGIHGVSTAYYTVYESMGAHVYIGFFTYKGLSYAISASGLDDGDFHGVISTIRAPGEKIEVPKPRKIRVLRKKEPEPEEGGVQIFKEEEFFAVSTHPASSGPVPEGRNGSVPRAAAESREPSAGAQALRRAQDLFTDLEFTADPSKTPFVPRRPLPLQLWGALIALWAAGSVLARAAAAKFQNPKLSPPPKDAPPDFFFPFLISRRCFLRDCTYTVLTRQKQLLLASFNSEYAVYLAGSVYAVLFFHLFWSALAFTGNGDMAVNAFLLLPGGRLWASAPELFLLAPFIAGLSMYFNRRQALRLYDSQSNLLMEAKKDGFYCLIRDGSGKEVARLMKKGGLTARTWDFVDTDNQVVFTIKDEYPAVRLLRKIFGRLGGTLRSHYGIFAGERRAGFVFLDPTSAHRFQIHLDFSFARLAHPAQILASVLYIISRENDPFYPWPF
ncbi:MAG: hypothetical protein WCW52_09570 [Elusimicrobiales bacterium]|jgi:hypothetical protein